MLALLWAQTSSPPSSWLPTSARHPSGTSLRGRARLSKAGPARVRATPYMAAAVAIPPHPPREGALRSPAGAGQEQDGRPRRLHAQTRPPVLRRRQDQDSLSSGLCDCRLTLETVSTRLCGYRDSNRKSKLSIAESDNIGPSRPIPT